VRSLQACETVDEAKRWHDQGQAFEVWAKVFKDDQALLAAKRLKLHAFRRMGALAGQLRPGGESKRGRLPGPQSLIMEHGFKKHEAKAACQLADVSDSKFAKLLERPLAPTTIADEMTQREQVWRGFSKGALMLRTATRLRTPAQVAIAFRKLRPGYQGKARLLVSELIEYLREVEKRI
jgi:hypothetical protein